MRCPFCKRELVPFEENDIHLDRCSAGHGIWFDGGELDDYRKSHPEIGASRTQGAQKFQALPGTPVKNCPRCDTQTLECGHLLEWEVRHCFTCHGVFLGQSIPMIKEPLDPTRVIVGSWILEAILSGFG